MKPLTPHDPLDDLIAAALHGELTPAERSQFETRLNTDPAAQAAYQEAQAMHDLLEKTHKSAQPDSTFEQRMVSGVRRTIQTEKHRETAWESLLALWIELKHVFVIKRVPNPWWRYTVNAVVVLFICAILAGVALGPITNGIKQTPEMRARMVAREAQMQKDSEDQIEDQKVTLPPSGPSAVVAEIPSAPTAPPPSLVNAIPPISSTPSMNALNLADNQRRMATDDLMKKASNPDATPAMVVMNGRAKSLQGAVDYKWNERVQAAPSDTPGRPTVTTTTANTTTAWDSNGKTAAEPAETSVPDTRKLIRNAQLDLEVKSFQTAMDQITALTKSADGYVDTSNSRKGGNGKLQGTVVVKVRPQNLDAFLLKLRDIGQLQNQSVSTDDVTKDYFDTQARLENSRRMETQLQDLLKHENSKVSDLLQVERELGRVRGEIEQMQGQLKLYDFQVQYATVTMNMSEKDMNQTAAYLLKEQDEFSLFATDVEGTFQKARSAADQFKTQVLIANLVHNSGSDVAAELTVMVAPDQIEPFLAQVRGLGRVANFTRQTQRVAKDGGDSNQPADQTLTEKDKVQVHLSIRSDDETRKQVALTVVAKAVDEALEQAKTAALADAGVEILNSSLNKTPQGQSTAQLTLRVPGKDYAALIEAFHKLGRTSSLSIQRNDNSGSGANGDDAPVIVSLSLTDDDAPLQETALSVLASDVDAQAQEIKKDAAAAGVEVKASSFERQPDGTESAQMTFRLPMSKYAGFLGGVKNLGKVESLTVRRDDRPDQTQTDDTAPVEISLQLHNQRDLVPDNTGMWATLRPTFGEGAGALFSSVRVIGVLAAFLAPWVFTLVLLAWIGRRIYVWRKNR
jgi:anti-sigma factor RsiW